ncbi:DUF4942 domain-containing protein [Mongoliibacter ruber]|uniref:Uncharacterized protein DUF4942 n=1 Tax=Mongoliibacter ruber TaxID=1750599 RepID=A0A2T0WV94_9BACT|nr:DUF4942 domain-containing protein [Mongoliibacter ruber]PRY90600.1 uncharacterized protein DUF4942 [Mongoliibacter ruber]
MFNSDFYPTPEAVIERITEGIAFPESKILEPHAGSGNMVDYCLIRGAEVIASEKEPKLRAMLKCRVIEDDFFKVKSAQISHISHIIMNPPFSEDARHILHAWEIAPEGCEIRALCNWETVANIYNRTRKVLKRIIDDYGQMDYLGDCFSNAERKTGVEVAYIILRKPKSGESEFEGFFMDEEEEAQVEGLQRYNFVRDIVGRYVGSVKIFDEQLNAAVRMNELTKTFYKSKIGLNLTTDEAKTTREEFKKDLQKSAWNYVLDKMNMGKYVTKSVKDDINKFVETQQKIPFTMKNIYAMIQMIVGTQRSRMDRALEDVFDRITKHYHENRYAVEGWKTNSHYLVNQKFILDGLTEISWSGKFAVRYGSHNLEKIEDLLKALCYITGKDYNKSISLYDRCNHEFMVEREGQVLLDQSVKFRAYPVYFRNESDMLSYLEKNPDCKRLPQVEFGQWFDWEFFEIKGYKKGTIHFKFKDENVWARFNQEISRIKGYPLFEPKKGGQS